MSFSAAPAPGLRDRKRAETRAELEQAAVDLVLGEGLDGATIEAISQRASVSPRTFFNYFESKDDAVLGIVDTTFPLETLSEIVGDQDDDDLVQAVTRLLFHTLAPSIGNVKLHAARTEIIQRYPQLLRCQMTQLVRMSEQLTALTVELMKRDPRFLTAESDASEASAQAEVLLMLCGGAVRSAVRTWVADNSATDYSATDMTDVEHRAVTLIREVLEKLQ
ncbi:MAG: TetR/AcrR family transcriptional regulator [Microbacteriaceae bacterium]